MYGDNFDRTINIIGVQSDCGASMYGSDLGVAAIRNAKIDGCTGIVSVLRHAGFDVRDAGNITPKNSDVNPSKAVNVVWDLGNITADSSTIKASACGGNIAERNDCGIDFEPALRLKNLDTVNAVNTMLYDLVTEALGYNPRNKTKSGFPLVLGGDHSISAGSIMAASDHYGKIGVIWVDAHGDFNDLASSPSRNIHGMPLSALTGNGPDEILPFKKGGFISPANTVIIGARALDDKERLRLKKAGVTVFTMHDVDMLGMATVAQRAIEIASGGTKGIYLSFDLDALDPSVVCDVGTPVSGGLTLREGRLLCELIAKSDKLIGLDMVELNPIANTAAKSCNQVSKKAIPNDKATDLPNNDLNKSALIALQLICAALGETLI